MSHDKKNNLLSIILFNWDPYIVFQYSRHNWVVFHPPFTLKNQGSFYIARMLLFIEEMPHHPNPFQITHITHITSYC